MSAPPASDSTGTTGGGSPNEARDALLAATFYVAVTLAFLWPLASASATVPNGDLLGHSWGLAWASRQLLRDPWHLYDANIYYPEPLSLRLTESLVPQSLLVAPLSAIGSDPLFLINMATLLSFVLNGLGAYLLARRLTRSLGGALFAGLAYGFCVYRWDHLVHLGVLSTQWFPVLLLLVWRQLEEPSRIRVALLAVVLWCQGLSSGYYAYPAAALAVAAVAVAGPRAWSGRALAGLGAAALAAALAIFPFARPYLDLATEVKRSTATIVLLSARPASFLTPGPEAALVPHLALLEGLAGGEREHLYPGTAVLLLALLALLSRPRNAWASRVAWIGIGALLLSLGPRIAIVGVGVPGPYRLLQLLPLGGMMRVPARIGILVQLGLATLAGMGWAALSRQSARTAAGARLALLLLWTLEAYPYGVARLVREVPRNPAFAAWLAQATPGPVLELPWGGPNQNGIYVYWSTKHWLPLVNGHGTFPARRADSLAAESSEWPMPHAVRALRAAGVRYVVVHLDRMSPRRRAQLERLELPPRVASRFEHGGDSVYEIEPLRTR